jgi:flagellar protein FlaG
MSSMPSLPAVLVGRGKDLLVVDIPTGSDPVARVLSVPVDSSADVVSHTESLRETTAEVARRLQDYVASQQREFRFVRDTATGYISVDVIDSRTGAVIRRLPGDEFLRIAQTFEQRGSVLVNQRA